MNAVLTGAARGLGAGIAARLARDGHGVALVDIDAEVTQTAEALSGADGQVIADVADVADEAAVASIVERAHRELGPLSVLVNCAGVGGPSTTVAEGSVAEFERVLRINLTGPFMLARAFARHLQERDGCGAIVNIGSLFGQQGVPGGAGYCVSKAGLAMLTQVLALELAPRIRANTIAPGNMETRMHMDELALRAERSGTSAQQELDRELEHLPAGRLGDGADVAGAVAWLISDDAAYVTGQTIAVNGGVLLS